MLKDEVFPFIQHFLKNDLQIPEKGKFLFYEFIPEAICCGGRNVEIFETKELEPLEHHVLIAHFKLFG
jgi:hypothetical protein